MARLRSVLPVLALLLVLTASAPPAAAASAPFLLTDAKDDVSYAYSGAPVPVRHGHWKGADIVSLQVVETFETLAFTVGVQKLGEQPAGTDVLVTFVFHGIPYHLQFGWFLLATGEQDTFGALWLEASEDRWQRIASFKPQADKSAGTLTIPVPRAYVLDAQGRMPVLGDALEGISAETNMQLWFGVAGYVSIEDRLPDDGDARYEIQAGGAQQGHVRLVSHDPVRVSNGESSTFIYHVAVENLGDHADSIRLSTSDAPDGWRIQVEPSVTVDARAKKDLVVLVSIPFAHDHGGFASFTLVATSDRAPDARAEANLGILHTPIPQPAGHHDELYLHTTDPNYHPLLGPVNMEINPSFVATMNADPDHSRDASPFIPGAVRWNGPTETFARWWIPLDPGLQMGLDVDLTRLGRAAGSIVGNGAKGEATATLDVYVTRRAGDPILVASGGPAPLTLDTQTPAPFEMTLTPAPEADLIPYEAGQNLAFELVVQLPPSFAQLSARPRLLTEDFVLQLPLLEYSDVVAPAAEATGALSLVAAGPVDKVGRPGATLAFPLTLTNRGTAEETIHLDLAGNDADVAELAPRDHVTLAPGASMDLIVGVKLPPDAADQRSFEVLIVARAVSDPTVTAIVRTRSTAAHESAAAVDDAETFAAAREGQETPGLPLVAALAAVGAAALAARSRGGRGR